VAADFFQSVVRSALGGLELQEVKLEPGSYVDEQLASSYSDLLYSGRLGGRAGLTYFLIEHQSTVYRMMALRINSYCLAALQDWVKSHPGAKTVPPIVPIVVHQGERNWNAPTELKELYGFEPEMEKALGNHVPSGGFILIDLKKLDLEELRCGLLLRLTLSLLKAVVEQKHIEWLEEYGDHLATLSRRADGKTILRLMLNYVAATRKRTSDLSTLREAASKVRNNQVRRELMTWLEAAKEEGREEGRRKGRQEGRQEGRLLGKIQVYESLLGKPQRSAEQLGSLSVAELRKQLRALEKEVKSRWKRA
jgi:predicted transposase YdaD